MIHVVVGNKGRGEEERGKGKGEGRVGEAGLTILSLCLKVLVSKAF